MSCLRARTLQKLLAGLCVAMTFVFCVQINVLLIDRIEHSLGIEHHGAIVDCATHSPSCAPIDGPDHSPVSHAHVGDTSSVIAAVVELPVLAREALAVVHTEPAPGNGLGPYGLDRPPKT